ncbi:MAG TPA: hypothetical protein VFD20_06490, partial [Demequina sp.]|nr:hypothetical protein [Demequina sp.]
ENLMTTNPASASKPSTPAKARATRKPTKSGDPRADRAAAAKKAATPIKAKVAPKAKPVTKKAATPKPAKDGLTAALIKQGWTVALTRNQAIAAYCKQRTLLHGQGPEAYRKAAAKALGISDEAFLAAFYAPKPEGK